MSHYKQLAIPARVSAINAVRTCMLECADWFVSNREVDEVSSILYGLVQKVEAGGLASTQSIKRKITLHNC